MADFNPSLPQPCSPREVTAGSNPDQGIFAKMRFGRRNSPGSLIRALRQQQPEVLILSGSVGMGHVRAAEGVLQAVERRLPDRRVAHLDVVKLMPKSVRKLYVDGYLTLSDKLPTVLGMAYRMTDSPSVNSRPSIALDRWIVRRLETLLIKLDPPIIVCTHFLPSRVAGYLREKGRLHGKLFQVVTDFDLHRYWLVPETDHYFVAGRPAADRLMTCGVPAEKFSLTGIPIGAQFRDLPAKEEARERLNLPKEGRIVLVTLGGAGRAPFAEVVSSLAKLKSAATIVVICGRNEEARAELAALLHGNPPLPHLTVRVEGFTKEMHLFMAASDILVGKPGGLTMSESLAAGIVPVLVKPIPGQEEHNSDYLLEEGIAVRCRYLDHVGLTVDRLLSDPQELEERSLRARRLGKPEAATVIAAAIGQQLGSERH